MLRGSNANFALMRLPCDIVLYCVLEKQQVADKLLTMGEEVPAGAVADAELPMPEEGEVAAEALPPLSDSNHPPNNRILVVIVETLIHQMG